MAEKTEKTEAAGNGIETLKQFLAVGHHPYMSYFCLEKNPYTDQDWCQRWGEKYQPDAPRYILRTGLLRSILADSVEECLAILQRAIDTGLPTAPPPLPPTHSNYRPSRRQPTPTFDLEGVEGEVPEMDLEL